MLFLKFPLFFPFLCHKSVTTSHIDPNKVSNSKLEPDLCNRVKIKIIEPTAPPQLLHKQSIIIFGQPVDYQY